MLNQPTSNPVRVERNQKIIAVASGKGGVGKTWCSIGISHMLSQKGERVMLFDGDLGLANVDIQLGLMPQHDLGNVINGEMSMRQVRTPYLEGGFDILAGRSGSGYLSSMPVSRFMAIRDELNGLTSDYDRVIIDLGAGVERTVRGLTAIAGTCVVVITSEPTSLTDAYAYIKLVASKQPSPTIRILVNMADSKEDGEKAFQTLLKACQNFLKIKPSLLGIIRRDKKVPQAIRAQEPIIHYAPTCDAATDLKHVGNMLL